MALGNGEEAMSYERLTQSSPSTQAVGVAAVGLIEDVLSQLPADLRFNVVTNVLAHMCLEHAKEPRGAAEEVYENVITAIGLLLAQKSTS
jgi:hypothetical protein